MKPMHDSHHISHSKKLLAISGMALLASVLTSQADIIVPGADGSDGAFHPTATNTIVDLSRAQIGIWNGPNTSATNGVYDEEKWAVVFRYSSVNIPSNVTVRFRNNVATAPVVWLVNGDVTITGNLLLDGEPEQGLRQSLPGPGGFRGGIGGGQSRAAGAGFGIGGGRAAMSQSPFAGGGAFGSSPVGSGSQAYGSSSQVMLLGGSGGGGSLFGPDGGGAGGGAILIASTKRIMVEGTISANGGDTAGSGNGTGGGGSGGAIRLVGDSVVGNGLIRVQGGANPAGYPAPGGFGRIRIESRDPVGGLKTSPVSSYAPVSNTVELWASDPAPRVVIQSIGAQTAPLFPNGGLNADMEIGTINGTNTVTVEAFNVAVTGRVILRATPSTGPHMSIPCTRTSGDDVHSFWTAIVPFAPGQVSLQVRATTP